MCYNKLVGKARKKWLQLSAIIYNTSNGDVRRCQGNEANTNIIKSLFSIVHNHRGSPYFFSE
jgi:hypothetical protein